VVPSRLAVRLLFRNKVLTAEAAWSAKAWQSYCGDLKQLLRVPEPAADKAATMGEYLAFTECPPPATDVLHSIARSAKHRTIDGIKVRFGSIHSVKGRTVDSILVVQSEIHLGPKVEDRALDLKTVLPNAFGIAAEDLSSGAKLAAATNVFVGITRTRELLGLALPRENTSDALLTAARDQGWLVRDLAKMD